MDPAKTTNGAEGVHLPDLPPCTTLMVTTRNSVYRLMIVEGPDVYIEGGAFFPAPTRARVEGAAIGVFHKASWIGVGMVVRLRADGRHIATSRVRSIVAVPPSGPLAQLAMACQAALSH
jgi:hypothetical protein